MQARATSGLDSTRSVLLHTASDRYEADMIRARLDSAEVPHSINRMAPQFGFIVGHAGRVKIYVDEVDLDRAREVLAEPVDAGEAPDAEERRALDVARLERRFKIARYFVAPLGVAYVVLGGILLPGAPVDGLANVIAGGVLIVLAIRSKKEPENALMTALLVMLGIIAWTVVWGRPFFVLPGGLGLLAVFYALEASVRHSRAVRAGHA